MSKSYRNTTIEYEMAARGRALSRTEAILRRTHKDKAAAHRELREAINEELGEQSRMAYILSL